VKKAFALQNSLFPCRAGVARSTKARIDGYGSSEGSHEEVMTEPRDYTKISKWKRRTKEESEGGSGTIGSRTFFLPRNNSLFNYAGAFFEITRDAFSHFSQYCCEKRTFHKCMMQFSHPYCEKYRTKLAQQVKSDLWVQTAREVTFHFFCTSCVIYYFNITEFAVHLQHI